MLSAHQVQSFNDQGFLAMPGLLAPDELERLCNAADRLQQDAINKLDSADYLAGTNRESKHWIEHPEDHYVYREKSDGSLGFHRVERMYTQDDAFVDAAVSPILLTHVWQVLQRPFWPRGGSLVVKLPYEGAEVRWHQDIPYLFWSSGGHPSKGRPKTHPIPNFTTDVYLDDSSPDNGCLWALPGSHRGGTVDIDRIVADHGEFNLPGAVPLAAAPGDVMFHHVALVHGSPENRASSRRRTFYVHYLCDETVQDAYSDWPDLMTPEQAQSFWGAALARRQNTKPAGGDALPFRATPAGFEPR
jgi:hypothetical protein